jgi:hypothetical protein
MQFPNIFANALFKFEVLKFQVRGINRHDKMSISARNNLKSTS